MATTVTYIAEGVEAQAAANEISKQLVRKQAETNDELRSQIATLTERCDSLADDNKKFRQIVNSVTIQCSDKQRALVTMVTDGFDVHAKALLDLDEKTTNAFNSVSKNEEAVAQAIVSLRKQLERPFPESSIFDGLLG